MSCWSAASVRRGEGAGRRERSSSVAGPASAWASKRARHLKAVLRLTPKRCAAWATGTLAVRTAWARARRSCDTGCAFHGMLLLLWAYGPAGAAACGKAPPMSLHTAPPMLLHSTASRQWHTGDDGRAPYGKKIRARPARAPIRISQVELILKRNSRNELRVARATAGQSGV